MNLILFSLLASFWGGSFVAIKSSLEAFPPLFSASLRVGVALIAIYALQKSRKISLDLSREQRLYCYIMGLFSIGVPFALLFWGEQFVPAGLAGVINGTTPIWTYLTAYYIFKTETQNMASKALGIGLSFLGIFIIFSPHIQVSGSSVELWGILAIFGMAISYGVGANFSKKLFSELAVAPKVAIFHQHLAALVFLLAVSLLMESGQILQLKEVPLKASLAILYLGLISTGLAFFIFFHLLNQWGPVKASSVTYLIPIVALCFDYMFYGNILSQQQILGVLSILLGLVVLQNPKPLIRLAQKLRILSPQKPQP